MKPQDIFNLIIKVGPYIKKVLKELSSYESRVRELAKDVSKLQRKQKRVQSKAREEERRHGRTIDDEVVQWLKGVDQIICLYGNFLKDEESQYAVFSNGYLPKPAIRYRLSVMVIYITKRVKGLLDTNLDNFSYLSGPPSFDADFDNIRYEMYESRNQTRAEIMAALADSNVGLIGVYGLSGVGKTSLIKEVAMEVKVNMFDEVIMVNVTSRPDIRSIQGQIADNLGVELKEESESGRAARLREILKNPKDKTLLILDNMVVKLDLNMLGIPSANIASSQTNHKTLMISSSEQLLLRQTDGRRIRKIRVEALTEEEAESMFKTMAEMGEDSTFKSLAAQIAKKCRGLPMTIVTTATALKGKSLPIWKDAYRRLESQNLTARPEFSTKLSYELLEDKELKHTFLICARMNHDALITDLVRYCIALGLFQGIYTVREATDRVHALVAKLKDLSLLSDSFSRDRFTMQDVVRDAALSIASQQMNAFALTKGKLDEWPDIDKLKRYTAISFDHCDLTDLMKEFSKPINCPRLRVFHLDNKDPLLHIPDNFFNAMKELRLLTLIGLHLSSLSSIKCLKKLRMLCLERCKLGDLSAIGELEKLRVLSLSGSDYDKLPAEFSQLTKLQILDMSDSFKLENIPAGVLSSLTSLEELYAGSSHIWKGQGNANLSELRQLNQLTTLDIQIPKITHFPENLFFDRLDSYKIVVREFNEYPEWDFKVLEMCEASRYLALQPENGFDIHHWKGIKILFERVENLLLGQLNDVDDIFSELNYEGFPYLKYLSIASNSKVQSIINSKNQNLPEKAFPELESLFLYEVNNMQHIFQSKFTPDSFCNLKIIKIKRCGQLKNVFFSSMIQHLSALETMEVSDCKSLKEIVTMKRDSNRSTDDIKFPGLRSLTLQYLSELNGFYTDDASTGKQALNTKPGELFDEKVVIPQLEKMELSSIKFEKIWNEQPLKRSNFQNLIQLDVNDCMNLRYLLSLSMAKILMNLQSLYVSQCGMMESIFKMEVSLTDIENGSIFPMLKNINLRNMKRLKKIWTKFPLHSFDNMDSLIIEGCNKLENVFPRYMVGRFRSVCNLKVNDCTSMKEIFDLRGCGKPNAEYMMNLQNFHVQALPKLEHVWNGNPEGILNFKNLKKILVQECLNLKHIFPVSIAMGLEQLECLEVRNCGQLKEIVSRVETNEVTFKFPELTTARFFELPNLEGFCGGTHELCCSILNDLSLEQCHKFKLFITELKPFFSPKEVIYNLKSMQIEEHDAYPLKRYMGNYRMHKLEEFQLSGLQDTYILDFFLHRNPNLKRLLLSNCLVKQFVPQISLAEKSGVVPKLKSLKLVNLPSLEKIGFEEYKVLFRMLECLILEECPCLNAIAASSVSFTYLTNLEVKNCDKLSHLMTASTAKSLVQLTTMKVSQCKSMVTIVLEPEHQEKIDFRELKEIELVSLQELESFCGSNLCILTFPSLEKFVVLACDKMETFTSPEQVNSTPVLKQVSVRYGRGEQRSYWKGDLNFTIRHMYKNWALDKDNMSASNPLEALQSSQLKTLVLTNCQYGANAIPTNLFTGLKNLEELEVSSSTIVNVIFDKFETDKMKGYTFPLKKLILRGLPNLKHVWDKDQERIFSFQNLQQVCVTDCHKLETLFPVELAKRIERLQKLEIKKCGGFVQIVQEEKDTIEEEFSFPRLSTLNLHLLPQLSYFYPGPFTLECPDLDHLEVLFCGNFESFQSPQEAQSSTSVYRQPLFSQKEANFILESLKLDWKNTMMLCNGKFPEDMLHKLVELELDFDDVNEVSNFPIVLLEKAFNLEYLEIRRCRGLEELLPSQPQLGGHVTTSVHSTPSFSRLKKLSIKECHGLRYLFTSSIARKLVHLELMQVTLCESMQEILAKENEEITPEAIKLERLNTIILDSLSSLHCFYSGSDTLQFPSLIHVRVEKCPKMKSFSTADAESLSGIRLTLDGKPILHQDINSTAKIIQGSEFFEAVDKECFSDGREQQAALDGEVGLQNNWFSNLEYFEASDNECSPSLDETILRGNVKQRKIWLRNLKRVKLKRFTRAYAISSDILPHLKKLEELEVKNSDQVQDYFEASDNECSPSLDETILRGNVKQRKIWLRNLKRVKLKRFTRAYAISSDILPHLKKLEELEVKNSDQVQDYFEASNNECSPSFDETILRGNVKQRKVWLRSLKRVKLKRFTRAYAISSDIVSRLNKLEELEVKNSDQVQEYFEALDKKCSPTFDETILRGNVKQQNIWLRNLKRLKLKRFTRAYVIPSYILPLLKKLEELEVKDSDQVEVIFDISDNEKLTTFPLKVLTLKRLSKLRKVWEMNTEGDTFSLLREVVVSSCENLQTLFSMAKNHKQLEKLEIDSCDKLLEMVDNEEGTLADATKMFVFPYLEKLYLHDLPELTYFYPETFTLNCPSLNQLAVLYCHKLKLFPSVYPSEDGEGIVNRLSLISDEKVIPNMKVLNLDWKHISALSLWFKLEQFMEDLEHLQEVSLSCFHPDENEKPVLQFEILQKAPNLEALDMGFLSSPEIFLAQTLKIGEDGILGQLKTLNLYEVSNLHSMESEDKSLLNTICEKLHELNVFSCHNLTTLIHSVSFSCLKRVKVYDCPDIQFLFTSSAAKTLTNLEEITVQECESVKEIVAKEREATSEIKFERLHTIILESLPSLICFYSGSDTLHLPSLINVDITECSNMKIFSQGDIVANEDLFSNQNLLANVKRMFQPQVQGIRDTQNAKI